MNNLQTVEKYPSIEINGEEEYSDSADDIDCDKASSFYQGDDDQSDDLAYYKLRGRRRRWTQRDMTNAFNAVKYQGMSLRGAATSFNVPESTLRDRVHGRVSLDCSRPGPPTFFTYEEERKMVDHILFMSKIGYPFTRSQVVELAGDMTKAVGRIAPFKYINPSQAWFYAFLNRWPDLKNFLFGPRNNRKSRGVSGDSIQSYFEQLDKVLTKYKIKDKPEHVWVVDETSVSCENQPPRIIPIGIQRAQSTSYWSPSVSLIGAGCANGEKVPSTLVYKGTSVTNAMMQGAVKETLFTTSYSGWVTPDTFLQWFTKVFCEKVYQRPLILFYDGHLQYISVRVLEQAREEGILLFPLPPHPAYNHCVENTCLWNYSQAFGKRVEKSLDQDRYTVLSRENIAPIITHAYHIAMKPSKLTSLFEKLGVCPFNNLSQSIGAYLSVPDDESMTNDTFFDNQSVNGDVISDENYYHYPEGNGINSGPNKPILHLTPMPTDKFNCSWSYDEFSKKSFTSQMQQIMILRSQQQIGVPLSIKNRQAASVGSSKSSSPGLVSTLGKRSISKTSPSLDSISTCKQSKNNVDLDEDVHGSKYGVNSVKVNESEPNSPEKLEKVIEETPEETPDFCIVCGRLEPPDLNQKSDNNLEESQQVVDWTKCDFCHRWVHLYTFCSEGSIITEDSYMCSVCNVGQNEKESVS